MTNKEAINTLNFIKDYYKDLDDYTINQLRNLILNLSSDEIEALDIAIKSLENEKPIGHWIKIGAYQGKCSCCNNCVVDEDENFGDYCRHCGAEMESD